MSVGLNIYLFFFGSYIIIYLMYGFITYIYKDRDNKVKTDITYKPNTTILICAYNEEKIIEKKIKNTLDIIYPRDKLKILVFDNGSTDNTYNISQKFVSNNISVHKLNDVNKGKSHGLNKAFKLIDTEIIAVTDVDCMLDKEVLLNSLHYFSNKKVGAITGSQVIINQNKSMSSEMEKTMRGYYKLMHTSESNIDSTIIYNGPFMAFRKELVTHLDEDVADDVQLAIKVRNKGYRALYIPSAIYYEYVPSTYKLRWKQKVRRGSQVIQALLKYKNNMFRSWNAYNMIIYPVNFFMYVISPYMLFTLVALYTSLFFYEVNKILFSTNTLIILAIFIVGILFFSYRYFGYKKIFNTLITFIHAQISLFVGGITLFVRKPYKWEPIEEVRNY